MHYLGAGPRGANHLDEGEGLHFLAQIPFHVPIGVGDGREPDPSIDLVCVPGGEEKANDTFFRPVIHDVAHHPRRDPVAALPFVDEHVANPGEHRVIGHYSVSYTHLTLPTIYSV